MTQQEPLLEVPGAKHYEAGYMIPFTHGGLVSSIPELLDLEKKRQEITNDKNDQPKPPSGGRRARIGKVAVEGNF